MSTLTPTPRTDAFLTKEHVAMDAMWRDFANTLERELTDMQARAEAAEHTVGEQQAEWDKLLKRVEAAEAACVSKDDALNQLKYRALCGQGGMCFVECKECKIIREAIESSPAETRSVIAGLREEVGKLTDELCELRPICLEHRDAHDAVMTERDALRAQLAALISAGNAMRYGVWVNGENPLAAWDSAVSGAHAGAKVADELADLCEQLSVFNWWITVRAPEVLRMTPPDDDTDQRPIYWLHGYGLNGNQRSVIEAMRAARKAQL